MYIYSEYVVLPAFYLDKGVGCKEVHRAEKGGGVWFLSNSSYECGNVLDECY